MPILSSHEVPSGNILVWKADPNENLPSILSLSDHEQHKVHSMKAHRRTEWYTSRHILHLLSGTKERLKIIKDKFGKPFWENSRKCFSISHSGIFSAAIQSNYRVGIDIQRQEHKILNLHSKFTSEKEYLHIEASLDAFHIIWGAKESMFKLYGRRQVDFKKHLYVHPFNFDPKETILKCTFKNQHTRIEMTGKAIFEHGYYLVWLRETARFLCFN